MPTNPILEHPRLLQGCRIFDDPEGLILRSTHRAHRIPQMHREIMLRVLPRMDGTRDFSALLGGEHTQDAFYAMQMVASLDYDGLIAEGPCGEHPPVPVSRTRGNTLRGITIIPSGEGLLARALSRRLQALGATVLEPGTESPCAEDVVLLVCPDGPDLQLLEEINVRMRETPVGWLPVFPFGDALVIGPLQKAGGVPCFRCFELRWLGISPSVELERAYFAHLRGGAWREEAIASSREAASLASLAAPVVARFLREQTGDSRVNLIRPENGLVSTNVLEAHPLCEVCANPKMNIAPAALDDRSWFEPALALTELRKSVDQLANGVCGFASIVEPPRSAAKAASPDLPQIAVARFALPEPAGVYGTQDNWSHGSAESIADARTLATIEACERYNGLSQPSQPMWSSYADIADRALLPTELPLFSHRQYGQPGFPFQPFDPARNMRWSWGYNLTRKLAVLVPTTAAWYGLDDELLGETSSGVAAHSSRGHALLNGALEIIERDAFMIHWLHCLAPPLIDLEELRETHAGALAQAIGQTGYTVRLADMTTDLGVPACLAIAFREDRLRPALLVGAGASLDPLDAATRALSELYSASHNDTALWTLKPPVAPGDVRRLEDHGRAYEHPDWLPNASFLWASSRKVSLRPRPQAEEPLDGLSKLARILEQHGHDLIGVDMTSPDVARYRLRVVRAIIPGLQPLGFADRIRLGGRRLYEAPVRMGYRDTPPREEHLNKLPHCFP